MNLAKSLALLIAAVVIAGPLDAQAPPLPIIDMHMHASPPDPESTGVCPGRIGGFPPMQPGRLWLTTFDEHLKKPPCADPIWSPTIQQELMDRTFAVMRRRNVYGLISGPRTEQWAKALPDRILPSLEFRLGAMSPDAVRIALKSGYYRALGEVAIQYQGVDASDARFDPYLTILEELDVPMWIHVGTGPPGAPYLDSPNYRARLHSPLTIEEALIKHPRLRISLAHAGWPMLDDLLAVMWTHPQVYIDVGAISFALPRAGFHDYLRRIVEAGFVKRVMFGSDQMIWPEVLEVAIQSIEQAAFLNPEQKRDIFYNNAARFLRLSEAEIASHAGQPVKR
jgi:uncharacterized protein